MPATIQVRKINGLKSFNFIGRAVTTTNEAEMKGEGVIPVQWERFYKEGIFGKIPNKTNTNVLAVYTDYESDETGLYTYALGAEVAGSDNIPNGMTSLFVPEASYVVFTTRKGPVQEVVVEAWQYIWEWSRSNQRAFTVDFEVYDERCADLNNSQVDIYISVK